MLADLELQVLNEGLRVLFLTGLPIVLAVMAAGLLSGLLMAAMSVQEPVISYTVKAIALVFALYLLLPLAFNLLSKLIVVALST